MYFDRTHISDEQLLEFYKALLYPRLVEEKMLLLLRQGRISKWFSGIGQEAIAVGAALALDAEDPRAKANLEELLELRKKKAAAP